MSITVDHSDVTQTIEPFNLNLSPRTCGSQIVEIIDSDYYPFLKVTDGATLSLELSTSKMEDVDIYAGIQLRISLPSYLVTHTNTPTFTVTINSPCA